ncbi:MAG: hypothetical protein H6Q90_999 [Deltaproteobacteria bacterium]|nr:hypothetical protein [Deltaproteobacteria bacterium]
MQRVMGRIKVIAGLVVGLVIAGCPQRSPPGVANGPASPAPATPADVAASDAPAAELGGEVLTPDPADRSCARDDQCATVHADCSNARCTGIRSDAAPRYMTPLRCTTYRGPKTDYDCGPQFGAEVARCVGGQCESVSIRASGGAPTYVSGGEVIVVSSADAICSVDSQCTTIKADCSNVNCLGVRIDAVSNYPRQRQCTKYTGVVANYDCDPRFGSESPRCRNGRCVSARVR